MCAAINVYGKSIGHSSISFGSPWQIFNFKKLWHLKPTSEKSCQAQTLPSGKYKVSFPEKNSFKSKKSHKKVQFLCDKQQNRAKTQKYDNILNNW